MRLSRLLGAIASTWLLLTAPLGAAGTVTQAHHTVGSVRKVVFTCTADAADASFPATAITDKIEGRIVAIETDPGATAPTALYDITLTNAAGADLLQGVGANRSTSATERAAVVYASTSVHPQIDETETLTLNITNNLVNSATVTVVVLYVLGG